MTEAGSGAARGPCFTWQFFRGGNTGTAQATGTSATLIRYAFVFVSFSQTLNRCMSASIFFRASVSGCLSLTWSPVIHELICYRNLSQRSAQDRVHAVRGLGCESRSSQGSQDSVLRQAPSMPPWMARGKGARPLPPDRDAGASGPEQTGPLAPASRRTIERAPRPSVLTSARLAAAGAPGAHGVWGV
jgi:hypothetical protein